MCTSIFGLHIMPFSSTWTKLEEHRNISVYCYWYVKSDNAWWKFRAKFCSWFHPRSYFCLQTSYGTITQSKLYPRGWHWNSGRSLFLSIQDLLIVSGRTCTLQLLEKQKNRKQLSWCKTQYSRFWWECLSVCYGQQRPCKICYLSFSFSSF